MYLRKPRNLSPVPGAFGGRIRTVIKLDDGQRSTHEKERRLKKQDQIARFRFRFPDQLDERTLQQCDSLVNSMIYEDPLVLLLALEVVRERFAAQFEFDAAFAA